MDGFDGLRGLFRGDGVIVVPPGEYAVEAGAPPIRLRSGQRVMAHGARFVLPETLGDQARLVLFDGEDVENLHWTGGDFVGHCFDPESSQNKWEPNASTRIFALHNSAQGQCRSLSFRDIDACGIAGAVVHVQGRHVAGSEREVESFAESVSVQDCRLLDCGKFMWDYGYLWQILVWPEAYTTAQLAMAKQYFPASLLHRGIAAEPGGTRLFVHRPRTWPDLCLFGDQLPSNIVRGRRYVVVACGNDWVSIAEEAGGAPIRFAGGSSGLSLIHDLHHAFYALFAPTGCGPGKGAIDLGACRNTLLTGNRLSARGDTMHLHSCHNNVFANNQILGSRMGAFFLSEWCKNSSITGNTVDGTNGSRVMSVERSNEDVTITGNTFRGGGRGSWINQPRNLILQGNIFINNTTKGERDPARGRRSYDTGDYERWPELYFTTWEPEATYGPVIIKDNLFQTGPEASCAIRFQRGWHDLTIEGNTITGQSNRVIVEPNAPQPPPPPPPPALPKAQHERQRAQVRHIR